MEKQELTHWGIKGMRWGIRRFQNKDGSLTEAGKKRKLITMRESMNNANKAAKEARNRVISEAKASGESKKLGSFRKVNKQTKVAMEEAKLESIRKDKEYNKNLRAERKAAKASEQDNYHEDYKKAHNSKSVKNMSDAELRSRLNRLQMEKQYSQLSDTNVNRGKQYFNTALKVGTTVAAVTTTGLTIYNNADKIKKIIEPMIKK